MVPDLTQLFHNQIYLETQIENIKCQLAWMNDFNLFQTFKVFDSEDTGYITYQQFVFGIQAITQISENQALLDKTALLFLRYDKDRDSMLSYPEFCQLMLPQTDLNLQDHLIARRPREYWSGLALSGQTSALL